MPETDPPVGFWKRGWEKLVAHLKDIAAVVTAFTLFVGTVYAIYTNRAFIGIKSSHISIRPFASTRLYMTFLAENSGNESGSIGRVTGQFIWRGENSSATSAGLRLDVMEYEKGQTIISPGSTQIIRVNFADEARLRTVQNYAQSVGKMTSTECIFRFEIVNYDGSSSQLTVDDDCRKYFAEYLGLRNRATIP